MRINILTCVVTVLCCSGSLAGDRYLEAGCPATDRIWRAADYKNLIQLLSEEKVPLPRMSEADGQKVLMRLCATDNLAFGRLRASPLPSRVQGYLELEHSARQLTELYVAKGLSGAKVGDEMSLLVGFLLHSAALGIDLAEEILPTIPKDDSYQARMAGFAQMKNGSINLFADAYNCIADSPIYTDDQRSSILAAVAATAHRFSTVLDKDTKTEMVGKFTKLSDRFSAPKDQKFIETITRALKGEQGADGNPR